jgi:hypothetical protein
MVHGILAELFDFVKLPFLSKENQKNKNSRVQQTGQLRIKLFPKKQLSCIYF